MVSLARSINTNSGGAIFFWDSDRLDSRELQPILDYYNGAFKPLKTIPAFAIHLLFIIILEIIAIVYSSIPLDENHKCVEYFGIIYAHIAFWFFTLVVDQLARIRHFQLRLNGYLEFYKKTVVLHRLPLYIVSLWQAVIMFIQTIMQHFYSEHFEEQCLKVGALSPLSYLWAFITLEFFLIITVNVEYIKQVREFNKLKLPPDVHREEWQAATNPERLNQAEIGYRPLGDKMYDFIEKQADLIRHLKEHNQTLSEKIVVLNAQIQNRNVPSTAIND